ncbi:hypothetical protein [uncultured Paraglaciecola sp.]|uniref:hypothetical protein n=1 Tax=uncultured Paraglaciecola sp. TaxID=1765024 RepID=UPI0030DAD673|tara:strand:- start:51 stop:566 length:516 start_codon:yes stop_codon:yes gene_type:complete
MQISSSYASNSLQAYGQQETMGRQTVADAPATPKDKVSLSESALELAAQAKNNKFANSRAMQLANRDEQTAEEMLAGYTHGLNHPLLDISNLDMATGSGAIYTVTGQPVTEESEALFARQNAALRDRNEHMIRQEREKDTPAAQILEKVMQAIDQQPQGYKDKIDWARLSA